MQNVTFQYLCTGEFWEEVLIHEITIPTRITQRTLCLWCRESHRAPIWEVAVRVGNIGTEMIVHNPHKMRLWDLYQL